MNSNAYFSAPSYCSLHVGVKLWLTEAQYLLFCLMRLVYNRNHF